MTTEEYNRLELLSKKVRIQTANVDRLSKGLTNIKRKIKEGYNKTILFSKPVLSRVHFASLSDIDDTVHLGGLSQESSLEFLDEVAATVLSKEREKLASLCQEFERI